MSVCNLKIFLSA